MAQTYAIKVIAHIVNDYDTKFGVPRQSGLVNSSVASIVFEPEYRNPDALRGMDGFSHLWLIWQFSEAVREDWSPTVRPPRLGGNTRMGVFATRSPFRPNAIGLSCVQIDSVEMDPALGPVIRVRGADLMNGTPIFDIKPYIPYADSYPDAKGGFAFGPGEDTVDVDCPPELLNLLPQEKRGALVDVLRQDPRPGYQRGDGRRYGISFAGFDVRFTVDGGVLHVQEIIQNGT
ncbi:MAG: tRNA (N6-threonylcarbamoyladenosine(37)-N6)-methyltransferase TrmO [Clostridia bacterium]|nr:tRNA (N6-threonylcarbamoyladenosine(37)-N6)-methyltransferase TrmO [Clostridia bacterium]